MKIPWDKNNNGNSFPFHKPKLASLARLQGGVEKNTCTAEEVFLT